MRGVLAIAAASGTANAVLKPLLPRRRPAAAELPAYQTIDNPPTSSSFPSGHAASAAAFATAVAMESPRLGLVVAPVAAGVAYSRVHIGVHWTSDVLVGAALGTGVALATRRWWPVREADEARARPLDTVPELPRGRGLVIVSNQRSGDPDHDPAGDLAAALPARRGGARRAPPRPGRAARRGGPRARRPGAGGRGGRPATGRWPRPPRWPGAGTCRWWWCPPARSTTSPATSGSTTCRRSSTPPARARASRSTWPWSTCTRAGARTRSPRW
jgi:hypothetical protein